MKRYVKLLVALTVALNLNAQAQDLTGTWEGPATYKNKKYNYTLYITKINGIYIGISDAKEASSLKLKVPKIDLKNIAATRVGVNTDILDNNKISVKARMLASFSNNVFSFVDLDVVEANTKYVDLGSGNYTYSVSNNKEKLTGNDFGTVDLTKKNSHFPEEFARYNTEPISFSPVKYVNGTKENKIKYNDKGLLSFTITNNSGVDFQAIDITLDVKEKNAGIKGLNANAGTFALPNTKSISPEIDINTGFNIPSDSIHLTVKGSYKKIQLFTKSIALSTIPFFLNDKTTVSESSAKVLSVLQGYYGFNNVKNSSVTAALDQYALSGNKLAPMWKAVFLTMGNGGYTPNEDAAIPMAKKAYAEVLKAARNGDAEGQYLMFYAVGFGITGNAERDVAGQFLKKAADAGFKPAVYDYALYQMKDSAYEASYTGLIKSYEQGMQLAAANIGYSHQMGYGVEKNATTAIEWYLKGVAFGDVGAMMQLARLYSVGSDDLQPNAVKAVEYASRAAALKSTSAMNYLGKVYLNGRKGVPKNIVKALALYKEAASLGDHNAMTSLAQLYLSGSVVGIPKDVKTGIMWTKKSAESGGAECMAILSDLYAQGKIGQKKDVIRARFWANQASLNGVGQMDNTAMNAQSNDLMNIIGNLDMSDKYSYYKDTQTGDIYRSNDGPDLLGSLFSSTITAMGKRRVDQQAVINGLEYMYTAGGKKIYGGTLTSKLNTVIPVEQGQRIKIQAFGTVSLGMWAGAAGPEGVQGFQQYCIEPSFPNGAVMAGVVNKWTNIGAGKTFVAPADGNFQLAINDVDYSNNKGYFDVVVIID